MSEKMRITLDREDLQAIFDIAVEGEGMMSGWWDQVRKVLEIFYDYGDER